MRLLDWAALLTRICGHKANAQSIGGNVSRGIGSRDGACDVGKDHSRGHPHWHPYGEGEVSSVWWHAWISSKVTEVGGLQNSSSH